MRTLVVAALALGLGSAANAGLILLPDADTIEGGTIDLEVYVASAEFNSVEFVVEVQAGTFGGNPKAMPEMSFFPWDLSPNPLKEFSETRVRVEWGDFFPVEGFCVVLTGLTVTRTGDEATVQLIATGPMIFDGEVVRITSVMDTLVITPEPMSVLLLGLGGLLLRRRR